MIKPQPFDFKALQKKVKDRPEVPEGWKHAHFGGMRAEHFASAAHLATAKKAHARPQAVQRVGESAFERCTLLTILQKIAHSEMVFVELGAGWGSQTLFVDTAIREQIVDMQPKSCWSLAVEAEPGHYRFLCEMFHANRIAGMPIYGAVSESCEWATLRAFQEPADHYGQSLAKGGNLDVPVFTLDYLVEMFRLDRIDLIHMDVQGVEPEVLRGSMGHIEKVDYLLVCPHVEWHMAVMEEILAPTHELCYAYGPFSGYHDVEGFSLPVHHPQDGIMVFERRGL